jgi:ribosome biogenesis GTPase
VIDTPGIREMGLWRLNSEQLRFYFQDFEEEARHCRFNDCTHTHEPDCAVRAAVGRKRISEARYAAYLRILRSLADLPAG